MTTSTPTPDYSNFIVPQASIDITSKQDIKPMGAGIKPTWNPKQGLDRQQEIDQARQVAQQDYQRQLEDTTPLGLRISRLELLVEQLIQHTNYDANNSWTYGH